MKRSSVGVDRRSEPALSTGMLRVPAGSVFRSTSGLRWLSLHLLVAVALGQARVGTAVLGGALPLRRATRPTSPRAAGKRRSSNGPADSLDQAVGTGCRAVALTVVADGAFATRPSSCWCGVERLPKPVTLINRLRLDTARYELRAGACQRCFGEVRAARGGDCPRWPTRLAEPDTVWSRLRVRWYGVTWRWIEVASDMTVWYHSGLPPVAKKLGAHPGSKRTPRTAGASFVRCQPACQGDRGPDFVRRWAMEVNFQEARAQKRMEGATPVDRSGHRTLHPVALWRSSRCPRYSSRIFNPASNRLPFARRRGTKRLPAQSFKDALAQVHGCLRAATGFLPVRPRTAINRQRCAWQSLQAPAAEMLAITLHSTVLIKPSCSAYPKNPLACRHGAPSPCPVQSRHGDGAPWRQARSRTYLKTASDTLAGRWERTNFHLLNQALFDGETMTDMLVGQHNARQITHDLMHINQDAPGLLRVKGHWLHVWIDLAPLLRPVSADFFRPTDETAFERFWPGYVRGHGGKGGVNVPRVEGGIRRTEQCNFW